MRVILILLLLGSMETAWGKLGESKAEIETRYGKVIDHQDLGGLAATFYKFKEYVVGVNFVGGKSVAEVIFAQGTKKFSEAECLEFAKAITGETNWTPVAFPGFLEKSWTCGDKLSVSCKSEVLGPDRLMIISREATDHLDKILAEKAKEAASGFGGTVTPPKVDPEDEKYRQMTRDADWKWKKEQQAKIAAAKAAKEKEQDDKLLKFHTENAEKGLPSAQYSLGMRYLKGDGVEKDEAKARAWLEKAAAQDNAEAKAALAKLPAK